MERYFQRELESLKTTITRMGTAAEDSVAAAMRALVAGDPSLAKEIVTRDERLDALELEIDNAIVDLLALQQPVAGDLRLIIAAQKINNDLERIGDHAVNIAQSVKTLSTWKGDKTFLGLTAMAEKVSFALRQALEAFIHLDADVARSVLEQDDAIDALNRDMNRKVIELIQNDRPMLECGLEIIRVSRNLERIADLATNIAEEVIFQTQARVVKHNVDHR